MQDGAPGRHAEVAEELAEWWEDLWQRSIGSRVVLVAVPPGWGRTTMFDHFTELISGDESRVTLMIRINGRELPDEVALQAAVVRDCLAETGKQHRAAELLGLDRLSGAAQLGVGIGGLFVSGLAAAVSFLLAGVAVGAAGRAWDQSPAGQDGALARAARAVAAASLSVPVVVILDDADCLDQAVAVTLIENLIARHGSQVLVVAAVDPSSDLAEALTSWTRFGMTAELIRMAEANPDMGYESRVALTRRLCPHLSDAGTRQIARRARTFKDVFMVAMAPRLEEINRCESESQVRAAVGTLINSQIERATLSTEATVVAWAGGSMHTLQAVRALAILGAVRDRDDPAVLRFESLVRLADPASPRLVDQVAALPTRACQAMAAGVLDEALQLVSKPTAGLVDKVVASQSAHRVRSDLTDRTRLPRAQYELVKGLEALGDPTAALKAASEALAEWVPSEGCQAERDSLAAAALRLASASPQSHQEPVVEELIAAAMAGGAIAGLEARVWAAVDLLDLPGRRESALTLIDQLTALLDERSDLGEVGDRWRLLLAFHVGRAGYPSITQRLLASALASNDPGQHHAAQAVLHSVAGSGSDTRLQNVVLEAELAVLPAEGDEDRLRLHHAIGANYAALGDYRQALAHGECELALRNRIYRPSLPDTLITRHSIADWTGYCGDARKALRLLRSLLPDMERVLGLDHPNTLVARHSIAIWTAARGDSAKALCLYLDLLPDMERVLGPIHQNTLATRHEIATRTGYCGDARKALRLLRSLLPDMERVLGLDHPNTLVTRNNIAFWTGQCGDGPEALRLHQDLLADRRRILGPDHPNTLVTRNNIAAWTGQCGDGPEALRLHQDLLADRRRILGPDHPDTLATRREIAFWSRECGDGPEALRLLRELLSDQERALGVTHLDTLRTRDEIAALETSEGTAR